MGLLFLKRVELYRSGKANACVQNWKRVCLFGCAWFQFITNKQTQKLNTEDGFAFLGKWDLRKAIASKRKKAKRLIGLLFCFNRLCRVMKSKFQVKRESGVAFASIPIPQKKALCGFSLWSGRFRRANGCYGRGERFFRLAKRRKWDKRR